MIKLINKLVIKKICFMLMCLVIIMILTIKMFTKESFEDSPKHKFKYTAVMIEPRQHRAISFVLDNICSNLSDEWGILVLHGNQNKEFVQQIVDNELSESKHRISLINLNVDNLDMRQLQDLLLTDEYYDMIPTETFLMFQTDSIICRRDKELINEFLQYDYVGAPWTNGEIGNCGLSLQKKSAILEKIKQCPYYDPWDIFIGNSNHCGNLNYPSFDMAKRFSVEQVMSPASFGIHKPWNALNADDLQQLVQRCDGLDTLIELNK